MRLALGRFLEMPAFLRGIATLRLTGLKEKFIRIAHNRGIRVHLEMPAFLRGIATDKSFLAKTKESVSKLIFSTLEMPAFLRGIATYKM